MRDKIKEPLRLEGRFVVLEEVSPKYFPYVIKWRNNPELNKFLNQPFELTPEIQQKWYEEKYLPDDTQGLLIMLDKATGEPFATTGWTDFDAEKRRCITGRLLLGEEKYAQQPAFIEGLFIFSDYLYELTDVHYIHVVKKNRRALKLNKMFGHTPNTGEIQYPQELFVNGMEQQEMYRTKETYLEIRRKIYERLNDALFS